MKTALLLSALAGASFASRDFYDEPALVDRYSSKRLPDSLFSRTSFAMNSVYEKPTLKRKLSPLRQKKIYSPYKKIKNYKIQTPYPQSNRGIEKKAHYNAPVKHFEEDYNAPVKHFEEDSFDEIFDREMKVQPKALFNDMFEKEAHNGMFISKPKQRKTFEHHPVRANMKLNSKEPDYVEKPIHINTGSTDSAVPHKNTSNPSSASTALYILGGLIGVVCAVAGVLMAVRPKGIKKRRSAMDTKPGMVYAKYNLDNVFEPSVSAPIPIVRRSDPQQRYPDVSLDLDAQRLRNMPSMMSMNESIASEYSPFDGRPLSYVSDKTERA